MKRIGQLLMLLGLGVGIVAAVAWMMGVSVNGLPLLVVIGLGKLTLVSSGALMAGGATLQRIATRREERAALSEAEPSSVPAIRSASGSTRGV